MTPKRGPCSQFSLPALLWSLRKPSLKRAAVRKLLSQKFNIHVEILFSEGDSLSKLICRKCEGFVSQVSDLKQKTQVMQIKLEQPSVQ